MHLAIGIKSYFGLVNIQTTSVLQIQVRECMKLSGVKIYVLKYFTEFCEPINYLETGLTKNSDLID